MDQVPGIPENSPTNWQQGLRFYYLAASTRALQKLGVAEAPKGRDWRREMVGALLEVQRKDGSWVNPIDTQKEDDPLVATSLALQALSAAWRS